MASRAPRAPERGSTLAQHGRSPSTPSGLVGVLEKIVRGRVFHQFQRPLPRDAEVTVEIRPSSEALASPQWRRVGVVPSHRLGAVFEYRYTVSPEDTDCTSWLFGFYDFCPGGRGHAAGDALALSVVTTASNKG